MSSESENQRRLRIQFGLGTLLLLTVFLSSSAVSYFRWPEWRKIQEFDGAIFDSVGIFSADDARMIHASHYRHDAIVRETSGFRVLCVLPTDGALKSAYISADGNHAILLTRNGDVKVWNIPNCKEHRSYKNVKSARFSPDGSKYVLCFNTGDVQVWSTDGEIRDDLKGLLNGEVLHAWLSRSNKQLLTYYSTDPRFGWDSTIQEIQGLRTLHAWSSCTEPPADKVLEQFELCRNTLKDGRRIPDDLSLPNSLRWFPEVCAPSNNEKRIVFSSVGVEVCESNHSAGWRGHLEQPEVWIALASGALLFWRLATAIYRSIHSVGTQNSN